MPDKIQHTAASLQQKMQARYNDGLHHKHNKNHLEYRQHCKSHPNTPNNRVEEEADIMSSTGFVRESNLRKMRTRPDKGQIH